MMSSSWCVINPKSEWPPSGNEPSGVTTHRPLVTTHLRLAGSQWRAIHQKVGRGLTQLLSFEPLGRSFEALAEDLEALGSRSKHSPPPKGKNLLRERRIQPAIDLPQKSINPKSEWPPSGNEPSGVTTHRP